MQTQKLVEALERVSQIFGNLAKDFRDVEDQNDLADEPYADEPYKAEVKDIGREVDADAPADEDLVEVTCGDLWRLVNRSRKMIRLARQGKIPDMEQRAPLCRVIKTLKQQGAIQKPRNPRD